MSKMSFLLYGVIIAFAIFAFSYVILDLEHANILYNDCLNFAHTLDNVKFSEKNIHIVYTFDDYVNVSIQGNTVVLNDITCVTNTDLKTKQYVNQKEINITGDMFA